METTQTLTRQYAVIKFGKYVFFPQKRRLMLGQQSTELTERENGLLTLFCNTANSLLPRHDALTSLWHNATYSTARTMDVYVSKLRKLLKDDPEIEILNVHGKGFKMLVPHIEAIPDDIIAGA